MSEEREVVGFDGLETPVDPETPYHAGERPHVKEKQRAAKRREDADRKVIRQIMGSNEGRDWMNRLLLKTHVSVTASSPWSLNPLEMAKACGEMEIGQQLLVEVIAACPERYIEMLKEANGERS